ncbi:MAG: hypothetical protein ACU0CC_01180 [Sagittula sp.]|uniref:hypothetical protein n=1 Tax=Sagittula sp. TaxID=2038081 RepID=UPI0040595FFD
MDGSIVASRSELYEKFGVTAEAAQLFETAIGTIVLAARGHNRGWFQKTDPDAAAATMAEIDALTLGRSLGELDKELKIGDGTVLAIFRRGLKSRNLLFHGFFERHNFKIQTSVGRDEMMSDLEDLHEDLFSCWQLAEAVSTSLFQEHVTEQHIREVLSAKWPQE